VERIPAKRRQDLVFIQNGMLDDALVELDCAQNTRGLLYFAASHRGAEIQPGGESIFTGPHAQSMTNWFHAIELGAAEVNLGEFCNEMASKLIWNCTFGLLCDVFDRPVGVLVEEHRREVDALISDLCAVSNVAIGTTLVAEDLSDELCRYSLSISAYRGSLKQWEWRNGWFVKASQRHNVAAPVHARLLVGHGPG
jgi:ketopantoate reductase